MIAKVLMQASLALNPTRMEIVCAVIEANQLTKLQALVDVIYPPPRQENRMIDGVRQLVTVESPPRHRRTNTTLPNNYPVDNVRRHSEIKRWHEAVRDIAMYHLLPTAQVEVHLHRDQLLASYRTAPTPDAFIIPDGWHHYRGMIIDQPWILHLVDDYHDLLTWTTPRTHAEAAALAEKINRRPVPHVDSGILAPPPIRWSNTSDDPLTPAELSRWRMLSGAPVPVPTGTEARSVALLGTQVVAYNPVSVTALPLPATQATPKWTIRNEVQ